MGLGLGRWFLIFCDFIFNIGKFTQEKAPLFSPVYLTSICGQTTAVGVVVIPAVEVAVGDAVEVVAEVAASREIKGKALPPYFSAGTGPRTYG